LLHDLVAFSALTVFLAAEPLPAPGRQLVIPVYFLPMVQLAVRQLPIAAIIPVAFWMAWTLTRGEGKAKLFPNNQQFQPATGPEAS
jgi:hypothetical protein